MAVIDWIAFTIGDTMNAPLTILLLIIAATFVLEDAATVAVGMLAAHGSISIEVALLGLVLGTIIGDFGLHLVGRWAAGSRRTEQFRLKPKIAQAEAWLLRRQMGALALARFIPGLRLPTFIASGVLKFPIYRTLAVLSAVTLVWTPALFWLSHSVMIAAETIGLVGWILAAALIVASVMAPRLANRHFAKAAAA